MQEIPCFLTAVTDSCTVLIVLQQCHEMSHTGIHKIPQHHTTKPESQVMNGELQGLGICYPIMTQCAKVQLILQGTVISQPRFAASHTCCCLISLTVRCSRHLWKLANKHKNKSKLSRRSCQLLQHSYAKAHLEFAQPQADYQRDLQLYRQNK